MVCEQESGWELICIDGHGGEIWSQLIHSQRKIGTSFLLPAPDKKSAYFICTNTDNKAKAYPEVFRLDADGHTLEHRNIHLPTSRHSGLIVTAVELYKDGITVCCRASKFILQPAIDLRPRPDLNVARPAQATFKAGKVEVKKRSIRPVSIGSQISQSFVKIEDVSLVIKLHANLQAIGAWTYSCLLYTSPSPRDKRQSRMPSSA